MAALALLHPFWFRKQKGEIFLPANNSFPFCRLALVPKRNKWGVVQKFV